MNFIFKFFVICLYFSIGLSLSEDVSLLSSESTTVAEDNGEGKFQLRMHGAHGNPTKKPTAIPTAHPTTHYPTSSPTTAPDNCFSGDDTMLLEDGKTVSLSDIKLGDRVLTHTGSKFGYSEVIYLPHKKNNDIADFVKLTLLSGKSISMSRQHLIFADQCNAEDFSGYVEATVFPLKPAFQVKVGYCVHTTTGIEMVAKVENIVNDSGVYTVITNNEYLVVSGFVASPFVVNHKACNVLYILHRHIVNAQAWLPASVMLFSYNIIDSVNIFAIKTLRAINKRNMEL